MDSYYSDYDYLMGNLRDALRSQGTVMKSRVRKRKIKELYERYKNSTFEFKKEGCVFFGLHRFSEN
jgi:uncharacterized protein YutD